MKHYGLSRARPGQWRRLLAYRQIGMPRRYQALLRSISCSYTSLYYVPNSLAAWQAWILPVAKQRSSPLQCRTGVLRVCPAIPSRPPKQRLMKASHDSSVTLIWQIQSHALAALVKPTARRLHFTKQGSAKAVCSSPWTGNAWFPDLLYVR